MKKAIIVTGSPATGKTTIAKSLAKKHDCQYLDLTCFIKTNHLSEGYDKKRKCLIVNIKKLIPKLIKFIEHSDKTLIIDGHLSHYLPPSYVKLCIVAVCDLKVLKKRMKKRRYPDQKIRENLEAEAFDMFITEAKEHGHKVKIIDTY